MADLDPQALDNFKKSLEATGLSADKVEKLMKEFGGSLKFVTASAKDINKGLTNLNKQVKDGERNYKDLGGELFQYQKQIKQITDEKQRERAQTHLNLIAQKAYGDTLKDGAKQIGVSLVGGLYDYYKKQVMTGIRGLQGDGSPFQVAADLQMAAVDSAAQATSKVSGIIGGVGGALMAIPHPAAQVVGALAQLGAGILDSGAKEAAELLKFSIEVTSKELDKAVKSFQQATGAGALFAGGMTELRTQAKKAGLTQEQFSKAIADNREALAAMGGSVTDGAKKLAAVGKESMQFRKSLLNLGISIEEQTQGQADYMAMLQQTGQLRGKSDVDLAKGSNDYLVNLKAISSFTGEEAKKMQARAREAAAQSAVQAKLMELGGDANEKFQNSVMQLPQGLQKAAQQLLAYGEVTDQESAKLLAQNPEMMALLRKTVGDVQDANVSTADALKNYQTGLKETARVGMDSAKETAKSMGVASLAAGQQGEVSKMSGELLSVYNKALNQGAETTLDAAKEAAKTNDPLTKGVNESVIALQDMKIAIQDMMTGPITNFANQVPQILKGLKNKLIELGLFKDEATVADEKAKTETKKEYDKAFEGAGFFQKYFQIGMTDQQKAANAKYYEARGYKEGEGMDATPQLAMANGGIASGPITGYQAMLHGNEAVIPLPDGRSVPIDASGIAEQISSSMQSIVSQVTAPGPMGNDDLTTAVQNLVEINRQQLNLQQDMVTQVKEHKDISEKILWNGA